MATRLPWVPSTPFGRHQRSRLHAADLAAPEEDDRDLAGAVAQGRLEGGRAAPRLDPHRDHPSRDLSPCAAPGPPRSASSPRRGARPSVAAVSPAGLGRLSVGGRRAGGTVGGARSGASRRRPRRWYGTIVTLQWGRSASGLGDRVGGAVVQQAVPDPACTRGAGSSTRHLGVAVGAARRPRARAAARLIRRSGTRRSRAAAGTGRAGATPRRGPRCGSGRGRSGRPAARRA